MHRAALTSGHLHDSIMTYMQGPGVLPGNPCAATRLESERPRVVPPRADLERGWRVHANAPRVLPMERVITCNDPRIAVLPRPVGLDMDIRRVLVIVSHNFTLAVASDTRSRWTHGCGPHARRRGGVLSASGQTQPWFADHRTTWIWHSSVTAARIGDLPHRGTAELAPRHTKWMSAEASTADETPNDETPGRNISGREFRETETGSSGNYPQPGRAWGQSPSACRARLTMSGSGSKTTALSLPS